jgi:mannose-6-phosphate isomerase-like protein (cupin superfamily)
MKKILIFAVCGVASTLLAQTLYAPKSFPAGYAPPHKPHTKLAEVMAKHAGQKQWRELVVNDKHLRSEYVYAAPGFKHPQALHPDTRAWWVILEGEVRFEIETAEPFTAKKGSMVQVPMQTFFSYQVTGSTPALFFETNIAGARTLYANKSDAPEMPGYDWVPVAFNNRVKGAWLKNNKPHVTYDEIAGKIDRGELKGTIRVVEDDRGAANFIYGHNSKLPALDPKNKGHYHPEGAEYWLIMSGQIRYPIENVGVVIAEPGDVVYVPPSTYHAPRWWGDGASCRLAMNGFPQIAHLFEAH